MERLMNKESLKFDKAYNKEDWTQYFGDKFTIENGSINLQEKIIEKYNDCLDNSNDNAIVWLGDLNIDENVGVYEIRIKNIKIGTRVKISKICSDIIRDGSKSSFGKGIFFILYSSFNNQYRISYVKYDKKANENYI